MAIIVKLSDILDNSHGLYKLANCLDWEFLIQELGPYYSEGPGRPEIPIRVVAGLHYLKYLESVSDEEVVAKFCENPYWQYFCGFETFQHEFPCHPTTLVKWRKRVGAKGMEKLLSHTIDTAKYLGLVTDKILKNVNVDTTVQEKFITFPTDSKLCHKARINLVLAAKKRNLELRQSYVRVGKRALIMQARYAHAKQMKRAKQQFKIIKSYLGRVTRDIENQVGNKIDVELALLLEHANRLLKQNKDSKNKLYSLHAPEVECIAKGKASKHYEFGCKVAIVTTSKNPWVIAIHAHHGNPYDGATLKASLYQAEKIAATKITQAFVDKGYRGKEYKPKAIAVYIAGKKNLPRGLKKLLQGRNGIEPIIGHLKQDHRLSKNYLLGKLGDRVNAILSGCGFNLRKILNYLKSGYPCMA